MSTESLNVRSVFDRALEIPSEAERTAFLDEVCVESPEIRLQVEALLKAHADAGSFLQQPAIDRNQTAAFCPAIESPGGQIGPYKLLEQIGEGGMGVVFMAEQTRPVQRRVALKIIKLGMDTRQVVARFEAERQALAMMDHPNIARVLDAGETDTGRPYFVMELVRGVPITEFCDQSSLSIPDRLALFVTVCQAVQHAHQKGIIHRDIKPTNVLVTLHDGVPVIKIIDFGVAKATGQKLTEKTLFTGLTQMIGTPLYMSPEQAEMSGLDVDTRSDIFSTGVLLYELLTGTTPFDDQRLKSAAFDELRRIIREEEPPRPSTQITNLAAEAASTVGTKRKSDPRQLSRLFSGELDWIVMKCLEKDRTRRYETASALAGDVERYLHDEPVQACPPSARYRFGKFARRNKAALATAALVVAVLVLGTVVSTWQAIRAFNAEAQSKASEHEAEESSSFLADILSNADKVQGGRAVTVAEVLDRSTMDVRSKFADNPATRADLQETIGNAYAGLGFDDKALALYQQVHDFRAAALGRNDVKTLRAARELAHAEFKTGATELAIPLQEETIQLAKTNLGSVDWLTLRTMSDLAFSYLAAGRIDDAIRQGEEAFKLAKATLGPEDRLTLASMGNLAAFYASAGRVDDAIRLGEEVFRLEKVNLLPDDRNMVDCLHNLARFYCNAGRNAEALPLFRDTLKLYKARLGPDHPETLRSMGDLAVIYGKNGRIDEAIPLAEETLELQRTKLEPGDGDTLRSMNTLADLYSKAGRIDEAIRLAGETIKLETTCFPGPGHPDPFNSMGVLGSAYARKTEALMQQGKAADSIAQIVRELDQSIDNCSGGSPRKRVCRQLARNDEIFNRVARLRSMEATLWIGRGQYRALRGEWAEAAADYAKVIEQRPVGDESFEYAGLLLLNGNRQAYQQFCKKLVKLSAGSHEPWEIYNLARTCALGPTDAVDGSRMVEWAARRLNWDVSWTLHALGLACFRAGQYRSAIENIRNSNVWSWGGKAEELPVNCLVLAMSHYRLSEPEDALRDLKQARDLIERIKPTATSEAQLPPPEWIEANVLLREAESLLKSDSSKPKSQTPMPHS